MKFGKMDKPIRSNQMQHPRRPEIGGGGDKHITPCTDCHKRSGCISEEIACEAFLTYANKKGAEDNPAMWKDKPRNPTKRMFDYIWGNKQGRIL